MTKVIHIVAWVPLIYAAFFMIYFIRIYQNELVSLDEYILEKQVNYAADAAVEELLYTSHLDQDYNKGEYITIEPSLAVNEFTSIMCYYYDMIPNDYSYNYIQQHYFRALLVCAWDGVYACWNQESNANNEYEFVMTPKIPYHMYDTVDGELQELIVNLGLEKAYWLSASLDANGTTGKVELNQYKEKKQDPDVVLTNINDQVGDLLNYALYQSYSGGSGSGKAYAVPALASQVKATNAVDKITVLGVIEGKASSLTTSITAECLGGARITANDPVIGYDTAKYGKIYAKQSFWRVNSIPEYTGQPAYYDSIFEAAQAGYNDYLSYDGYGEVYIE